MCTVTLDRSESSLRVTMNRDEALTRGAESPPRVVDTAGKVAWMAPRDSESGGTWMGVNACGVVACLLNGNLSNDADVYASGKGVPSRGGIIPRLLERGPFENTLEWTANEFDPAPYASFFLLVAELNRAALFTWTRRGPMTRAEYRENWLTSSSWMSEAVRAWRGRAFREWEANGRPFVGRIPAFHLLQAAGREDWSPLMDRPWSATRSITQAEVSQVEGVVRLRYWPRDGTAKPGTGPPFDVNHPGTELSLPLIRVPGTADA